MPSRVFGRQKSAPGVDALAPPPEELTFPDPPGHEVIYDITPGQLKAAGYLTEDISSLAGRELGEAVANGFFAFAKAVNFPTTLDEVAGFTQAHIDRALIAAKNPQLKMKLENMPIPLTAEMIDEYMGPILEAGRTGDLSLIKNV